jgi:hypothetical protein
MIIFLTKRLNELKANNPSITGHGMAANFMIDAINQTYYGTHLETIYLFRWQKKHISKMTLPNILMNVGVKYKIKIKPPS